MRHRLWMKNYLNNYEWDRGMAATGDEANLKNVVDAKEQINWKWWAISVDVIFFLSRILLRFESSILVV